MKLPWVLIGSAILTFTALHLAYVAGQQEQRNFETLCRTPGVECLVRFDPAWLQRHSEVHVPPYVGFEFASGIPWAGTR